jgi:hypothetical protein
LPCNPSEEDKVQRGISLPVLLFRLSSRFLRVIAAISKRNQKNCNMKTPEIVFTTNFQINSWKFTIIFVFEWARNEQVGTDQEALFEFTWTFGHFRTSSQQFPKRTCTQTSFSSELHRFDCLNMENEAGKTEIYQENSNATRKIAEKGEKLQIPLTHRNRLFTLRNRSFRWICRPFTFRLTSISS